MASKKIKIPTFSSLFLIYLHCLLCIRCQDNKFELDFKSPQDCDRQQNEYFDAALMECKPCTTGSGSNTAIKTSTDMLSCVCAAGAKKAYILDKDTYKLECTMCGEKQVPTEDGRDCTYCPNKDRPTIHSTCEPCDKRSINVEAEPDGNFTLEREQQCITCVAGTKPVNGRCRTCYQFKADQADQCNCENRMMGGICFAEKTVPTIRVFDVEVGDGTKEESPYLKEYVRVAHALCKKTYRNATACQHFANMCVLQYSSYEDDICTAYRQLTEDYYTSEAQEIHKEPIPWLYINDGGDQVLGGYTGGNIGIKFGFAVNTPNSRLNFVLAKYSDLGKFLGYKNVTGGTLQLCSDTGKKLDAAYQFGTEYIQECEIDGLKLFNKNQHPLVFYDIYLRYTTAKGTTKLFVVPVLNVNLKTSEGDAPNTATQSSWKLVRRFFMVDNVATAPISGGDPCGGNPENTAATFVRYPTSISFTIRLRMTDNEEKGFIYPPHMRIEYAALSCADAVAGIKAKVNFKVEYTMSEDEYDKNFKIGAGTLGTFMILLAAYRTWVWSKRAGRIAIDFLAIINFVFQAAGALANAFFVLTFGSSFYWLMFYKNQEYAIIVLPEKWAYINFLTLLGIAFALKTIQVAYMVFMQCTSDIFLIDWERPRANATNVESGQKKGESTTSVWRTYFIANEFNELQASRRLSPIIQIFTVVFFLEVVGFVNVSTTDPHGTIYADVDEYHGPQSHIFRYAVSTLIFMIVGLVQWLFIVFIYNQFIEDPINSFVDLCSMCNVSVFVMANAQYGYYVHGRSVHGKGDADLKEMHEMMKREEEDLCGQRGLLPNSEQQTFEMSLPWRLRAKYDQMYLPVALQDTSGGNRGDAKGGRLSSSSEKTVAAYLNMNKFLSAFIDHSLREIDYVVKDKGLLEKILNTEFLDAMDRGIFYNDNGQSFTSMMFYGSEISLMLFDLLCFSVVDLMATNYLLSGIIAFFVSQILRKVRESGGRRNLARKTMVDERFLI